MSVDLLFVAWNRRRFVEQTFGALLANTNWDLVRTLHVHDDASTDGTKETLSDAIDQQDKIDGVAFESLRLGGPVAATNRHLDLCKESVETQAFVKIDSDMIVSPGWLDELLRVASSDPGVDFLGIQPRFGPPVAGDDPDRRAEGARHIGGIGFMRYRAFEVCRPTPNGLYGFTEFQTAHPASRKAWVTPDLPCFCLDLIDLDPWASLTAEYVAAGWARAWPKYEGGGSSYYDWWAA